MKLVADFENMQLEHAFDLSATHFLNDLSYLKAKDAHDRRNARDAEY